MDWGKERPVSFPQDQGCKIVPIWFSTNCLFLDFFPIVAFLNYNSNKTNCVKLSFFQWKTHPSMPTIILIVKLASIFSSSVTTRAVYCFNPVFICVRVKVQGNRKWLNGLWRGWVQQWAVSMTTWQMALGLLCVMKHIQHWESTVWLCVWSIGTYIPKEWAAVVWELKNRPSPKSPSFTTPVAVMKTLAGLISRGRRRRREEERRLHWLHLNVNFNYNMSDITISVQVHCWK